MGACLRARGRVIEVGSGDGRSFEHYPARVESLLAVEPDLTARAAAAERAEAAQIRLVSKAKPSYRERKFPRGCGNWGREAKPGPSNSCG